jgi:hypothetical protein
MLFSARVYVGHLEGVEQRQDCTGLLAIDSSQGSCRRALGS